MKKIKIGILCPSEIAFRRFMPALLKQKCFEYVGIASANEEEWFGSVDSSHNLDIIESEKNKALNFINTYGGQKFSSYLDLLTSSDIDAVYIPLPPALHYKWAKRTLENGKHVLLEKPFTIEEQDTASLITLANERKLALHENYMFAFHSQIETIKDMVQKGDIGKVRLYTIRFGFPFRGAADFRYNKKLGGGALFDCGGYTVKLSKILLGENIKMLYSQKNYDKNLDIDLFGSAAFVNDKGIVSQVSYGMDNSYKCSLEIWGSEGTIYTNRILTAPNGFEPEVIVEKNNDKKVVKLDSDDTFYKSIYRFYECIIKDETRLNNYQEILSQAKLIEKFKEDK